MDELALLTLRCSLSSDRDTICTMLSSRLPAGHAACPRLTQRRGRSLSLCPCLIPHSCCARVRSPLTEMIDVSLFDGVFARSRGGTPASRGQTPAEGAEHTPAPPPPRDKGGGGGARGRRAPAPSAEEEEADTATPGYTASRKAVAAGKKVPGKPKGKDGASAAQPDVLDRSQVKALSAEVVTKAKVRDRRAQKAKEGAAL
jgi:hypothetical protein